MIEIRKSTTWIRYFRSVGSACLLALLVVADGYAGDNPAEVKSFMHEAAGINFYVETSGSGPTVVLVPSGQGDSGTYKYLAETLADEFTVITFDMPGFSRSGPPPTWDNMSAETLGNQVAALVESLGVKKATFYGSSSGGVAVLSVVADHPELVRNAVVHEPAVVNDMPDSTYSEPFITGFPKLVKMRADQHGGFAQAERAAIESENSDLILNPKALKQLGEGYIERRANNFEVWYERYVNPDIPCCKRSFSAEELNTAPVTVTAGQFTMGWAAAGSIALAQRGDLELVWLPAKHFPYVSVPEIVADVVRKAAHEHQ